MDILGVLELAEDAAGRQNPLQTFSDLRLLYGFYQNAKAGNLDIGAMAKAKTLEPVIAAGARSTALADALMKDPAQGPRLIALLTSLP